MDTSVSEFYNVLQNFVTKRKLCPVMRFKDINLILSLNMLEIILKYNFKLEYIQFKFKF